MRVSPLKLATLALLLGTANPAFAEDKGQELISYQLENGLQVVLQPDDRVPKVTSTMRFRVGSMSEPDGRSGFAHLFEHLVLFAGTENYPYVPATLGALGVEWNGFTMEDGTVFYQSGLSSTLPVMLSIQADQMANTGRAVDQLDLDTQRSVVLNEMRQNVLDSPGSAAFTALQTSMFGQDHPYRRAVLGSIPDVNAATLDDVQDFFNAYYVPNNAVLVIVGDIDVDKTKAMIEDTFGRIARGADVAPATNGDGEPGRVRMEFEDVVNSPMVILGFTGPEYVSSENAGLAMAANIFSNESGLLRRRLVETGMALDAGAYWSPSLLGGRFMVYGVAAPNTTAEALEAELRKVVTDFAAGPIDPVELERARDVFLLNDRTALEGIYTRADYIAKTMAFEGDITGILGDDPDLVGATTASVEAAVRDVLNLDDVNVAIIRPGTRGNYPDVLSQPSGEPKPIVVADREPVELPKLEAGEPERATLPTRELATLSNGIKIIHYQMDGAPLEYLSATVTGGSNNDPRGQEGIYDLAFSIGALGTEEFDRARLGAALKDIGAVVSTWNGSMISGASLQVPAENLAAGIDYLADVIQTPRFDAKEWEIAQANMRNYLVQREFDVGGVAARALRDQVFFPKAEDSANFMTRASLDAISIDDAKAVYDATFSPKSMTIYSVGELPLDQIVAALEARLGSWEESDPGVVAKSELPAVLPDSRKVVLVPVPGATQATIYLARRAPSRDDAGFAESVAVANLLGGDFLSRLNLVIREQKGYSYGVSAQVWEDMFDGNLLTVSAPVQLDATGAALAEVFKGFDSLKTTPVTEEEVNRTKISYYSSLASLPETAGGFFSTLVGWESSGIDLDTSLAFFEGMTALDVAKVQAMANELAALDNSVIIIAGDVDAIKPQLEAIGITDVTVAERPTTTQ